MNPTIKKVINKLKTYPGIKYLHTDNEVTIEPKDEKVFLHPLRLMTGKLLYPLTFGTNILALTKKKRP